MDQHGLSCHGKIAQSRPLLCDQVHSKDLLHLINQYLYCRSVFSQKPLPERSVLSSVINVEKDFELLSQIGAHQALHMDKQVMGACSSRGLLLAMPMLHLWKGEDGRGEENISINLLAFRPKVIL